MAPFVHKERIAQAPVQAPLTTVVNLRDAHYDVYIGRAGKGEDGTFGNPYWARSREENIADFKRYFEERLKDDPTFKARVEKLRGKVLGCFCKPLACHGDVIAEYLNKEK